MRTVRLKINDKVYDKVMWLLGKFSRNEVEIIPDDPSYIEYQEYLQNELDEINDGKARFYTTTELEARLDNVIKNRENTI
ncbi:MAG: hypothetical protein J7K53_09990 [Bacteroidales bacterium]|nr:hypothetical protein [Bacteroidales bacterium]